MERRERMVKTDRRKSGEYGARLERKDRLDRRERIKRKERV